MLLLNDNLLGIRDDYVEVRVIKSIKCSTSIIQEVNFYIGIEYTSIFLWYNK